MRDLNALKFYEKSRRWLKNSCAPTMKMVLEADQALGRQDFPDMIINAELSPIVSNVKFVVFGHYTTSQYY